MKIQEWASHAPDGNLDHALAQIRARPTTRDTGLPPAWPDGIPTVYDELPTPSSVPAPCTETANHFARDQLTPVEIRRAI
jgi:hypothetical protein